MDPYTEFLSLPAGASSTEFTACGLSSRRTDFLAKGKDGNPIVLLRDEGLASYVPAISLRHVAVEFRSRCRVSSPGGLLDGEFAIVSCDPGSPELYELFVRCVGAAIEQLPVVAMTSDLAAFVRSLLDLFRNLGRPTNRQVTGLWAELYLIHCSRNVAGALEAWHSDPSERFDFSWQGRCLEVKASVTEVRVHEFALEQLRAPAGGIGAVASLLLQPEGGGVGVMELARRIEAEVMANPALRQKLWLNVTSALGSDFSHRLDRRFGLTYAANRLQVFAMSDVPAPGPPADPRVTSLRFRSDLSAVTSSITGPPLDALRTLFR